MIKQNLKLATSMLLLMAVSTTMAQSTKNVNLKNFSGISVSSGIDLYLSQGSNENISLKGDDEMINEVLIEQKDNDISIKFKPDFKWKSSMRNKSVAVYVDFKTLSRLAASGGSDVKTLRLIKGNQLLIVASGGSDLDLNLDCSEINLTVNGGSDAKLSGTCEKMILTANGGSDVNAVALRVDYAKVAINGGSDADLTVNKTLEASANGGSDLSYRGNAVLKKVAVAKSSDVSHIK